MVSTNRPIRRRPSISTFDQIAQRPRAPARKRHPMVSARTATLNSQVTCSYWDGGRGSGSTRYTIIKREATATIAQRMMIRIAYRTMLLGKKFMDRNFNIISSYHYLPAPHQGRENERVSLTSQAEVKNGERKKLRPYCPIQWKANRNFPEGLQPGRQDAFPAILFRLWCLCFRRSRDNSFRLGNF